MVRGIVGIDGGLYVVWFVFICGIGIGTVEGIGIGIVVGGGGRTSIGVLVVGVDGLMLCSVDRLLLFLREGLELRALRFFVGDFSRTLSGPGMFFCISCIIFIKLFSCSCIEAACGIPVVGAVKRAEDEEKDEDEEDEDDEEEEEDEEEDAEEAVAEEAEGCVSVSSICISSFVGLVCAAVKGFFGALGGFRSSC